MTSSSKNILQPYVNTAPQILEAFILFFGPCIFNNEDKKLNQQNARINSGLIYYW